MSKSHIPIIPPELWGHILPPELWCRIVSYLPPWFQDSSKTQTKELIYIWNTIFENNDYLNLAVEKYQINPMLVGSNLPILYNRLKKKIYKKTYLVLITDDWSGDLHFETFMEGEERKNKIFQSLQIYTNYNKETQEVTFDNGIILNIMQPILGTEEIILPDLKLLFQEQKLRTAFCYCSDSSKIEIIKEAKGIGGKITRLKKANSICSLSLPGTHTGQITFVEPSCPSWRTIYKQGEKYPDGEIVGFEYC